jgi:NTE family protein
MIGQINHGPRFRTFSFLIIILSSSQVYGQSYRNLVFEGGGVRGIAYAGAILELEQQHAMEHIEKVGGTSVGALAALLVSLGYNAKEIETITSSTKLQKFNDGGFFFVGGLSRMNRKYGWYKGNVIMRWFEKIISEKTGNPEITFREMHEQKFRDLYVTGTSLNHQKLIIFSYENYPDMKVKDALRISVSIPLYFEAVFIDAKGKRISQKNATGNYDIMVDGGITGNFPIFMFDSLSNQNGQIVRYGNPYTLGLRVDTPEQIFSDHGGRGLVPMEINHFNSYVFAFYSYVLENLNRPILLPIDWKRSISISSGTIGPKIRRLSMEEKAALIQNGQAAVKDFLQFPQDSK